MMKSVNFPGWLGIANVVFSAVMGGLWLWFPVTLVAAGLSLALAGGIGLLLLFGWIVVQRCANAFERYRSEAIYGLGFDYPPRVRSTRTGVVGWIDTNIKTLGDPMFWRETFLHYLKQFLGLFVMGLASLFALGGVLSLGVAINPDGAWALFNWQPSAGMRVLMVAVTLGCLLIAVTAMFFAAVADFSLDKWLLSPPKAQALQQELTRVDRARVGAVDAATSERLRIERDLHDGVQPTLVALSMKIGMAKSRLERDPAGARDLLAEAHADSKAAITELRELVRGIHPAVLTDRGLDPAISALAARSAVPVEVRVDVPRLPPEIESVAYFVVAEALSNVGKHSRATQARVDVTLAGDSLVVVVEDNGRGGARVATDGSATGLAGLVSRVVAARGHFEVRSPVGGPTTITVELPCA